MIIGHGSEGSCDDAFGEKFLALVSTNGEKSVPEIPKV